MAVKGLAPPRAVGSDIIYAALYSSYLNAHGRGQGDNTDCGIDTCSSVDSCFGRLLDCLRVSDSDRRALVASGSVVSGRDHSVFAGDSWQLGSGSDGAVESGSDRSQTLRVGSGQVLSTVVSGVAVEACENARGGASDARAAAFGVNVGADGSCEGRGAVDAVGVVGRSEVSVAVEELSGRTVCTGSTYDGATGSTGGVGSEEVSCGCRDGSTGQILEQEGAVFVSGTARDEAARGSSGGVSGGAAADGCGHSLVKNKKLGSRARRRRRLEQSGGAVVPEWRRGAGALAAGRERVGKRGFFSEASEQTRVALRESRADRLTAENKLAAFKAQRQLEVESSQDVVQLKKRREVRLLRDTECDKVQIERAYGTLAAAGDVPGVGSSVAGGGKVEGTVATGGTPGLVGGSISPNSSASMKEFHAAQKKILSQAKDIEDFQRKLDHLKLVDFEAYCKIGGGRKRPETVDTGFTLDTNGEPTGQLGAAYSGYVGDDGRFHMGENPAIYDNW